MMLYALFSSEKSKAKYVPRFGSASNSSGSNSLNEKDYDGRWKNVRCHRCKMTGHIRRNCCEQLRDGSANLASEQDGFADEQSWEQCFSATVIDGSDSTLEPVKKMSSPIDYKTD